MKQATNEMSCVVLHSSFPEDAIQYNIEWHATGGEQQCQYERLKVVIAMGRPEKCTKARRKLSDREEQ